MDGQSTAVRVQQQTSFFAGIFNFFWQIMKSILTSSKVRTVGAAFLVSGTCIGAGMLSLPVATAAAGFYPTMGVFAIVWTLMTFTALVMLEVSLWHKEETNIISMAKATLGTKGQVIAWITYILFLYSLMAAYTSSGSALLLQGLQKVFPGYELTKTHSAVVYTVGFAAIVYVGAKAVDYVNRFLIAALIAAYLLLTTTTLNYVNPGYLTDGSAKFLWAALPLVVTSFGFHLLIPTLKTYLNNDAKKLRQAIIIGSLIPLVVYIAWELIILGLVPTKGDGGLIAMLQSGEPIVLLTKALDVLTGSSFISAGARFFTFFAVVSSFIGVALGLFDFLADGLHIKKSAGGRLLLAALTFLPPLVYAFIYPEGFILALGYAGIFAAILLIIYPCLMAYYHRYILNNSHGYEVAGGKLALIAAILFAGVVIVVEVLERLKMLPMPT